MRVEWKARQGPPGGGKTEGRGPRAEWRRGLVRRLAGDLGERAVVDALRYLAAAKARTVVQGRLRGL